MPIDDRGTCIRMTTSNETASTPSDAPQAPPRGIHWLGVIGRFFGWWFGLTGLVAMVATCPCCGLPGCPTGSVGTGAVGAVLITLIDVARRARRTSP